MWWRWRSGVRWWKAVRINRKGLQQAIAYCKENGCKLVIAKLDRLCRDVGVLLQGCQYGHRHPRAYNQPCLVFAAVTREVNRKALPWNARLVPTNIRQYHKRKKKKERNETRWNEKKAESESRDMTAMFRILHRVFPESTNEPAEGLGHESTANGAKDEIYALMNDYKEMDDTGATFKVDVRWNGRTKETTKVRCLPYVNQKGGT